MEPQTLQDTAWLAKRLNLSITTIERMRAKNSSEIPPHLTIGHSLRYDEAMVEQWIRAQFKIVKNVEVTENGN
jgi:hypothetical protein